MNLLPDMSMQNFEKKFGAVVGASEYCCRALSIINMITFQRNL